MRRICILFGVICAVLYAGTEYDFYMISDTHFGTLQSFGENPPPKLLRKGQRADAVLPLFHAFFASMRKSMDEKTAFIIHGGDLIEGNAHDKDSQIKQFTEARKLLKEYFACPIYMVRGNHEASGLHGGEAYKEQIAPAIALLAGKSTDTVHYTINHGEDIFIFLDAYANGWLNYVGDILKGIHGKPRYLFVVMHPDQLPHVRKDVVTLFQLLAPYKAVVLTGHTHRTRLLKYARFGNETPQFTIGSHLYAPSRVMQYKAKTTVMKDFLDNFRNLRVRTPEQIAFFDKEIVPYLSYYEEHYGGSDKFQAQGYAKIHVSDAGVIADIQSGDLNQKPFQITILDSKGDQEAQK